MTSPAPAAFEIVAASAQGRRAALELVFGDLPVERRKPRIERLLEAARAGSDALDGLFVALRGSTLVGAVLVQPRPGRVAGLWPPVAADTRNAACEDSLLAAAVAHAAVHGARLAQAVLPVAEGTSAELLRRHDFSHLADLLYMASLRGAFPTQRPDLPVELTAVGLTPAEGAGLARLAGVVGRTYEGTLDCPALNGVRSVDDVLTGYRAGARDGRREWLIAHRDGADLGCLLLSDQPDDDQVELVYLGLVPEARRQGLGRALTRYAQWRAGTWGRGLLVLAVDAANRPAVQTYAAAGFAVVDRRSAFMRVFRDVQARGGGA